MNREEWRALLERHAGELFAIRVKGWDSEHHGGMPGRYGGGFTIDHHTVVSRVCLIDNACLTVPDSTLLIAREAILVIEGDQFRFDDKVLGLSTATEMRRPMKFVEDGGSDRLESDELVPSKIIFSSVSDGIRAMDIRLPTQLLEDPRASDTDSKIVTREIRPKRGAHYSMTLVIGNERVTTFFKEKRVAWGDSAILALMKDASESARTAIVKAEPYLDRLFNELNQRRNIITELESNDRPRSSSWSGPDGSALGHLRKSVLEAVAILEQLGCSNYPIIAYAKRVLAMMPDAVPHPTPTGEPKPVTVEEKNTFDPATGEPNMDDILFRTERTGNTDS